MLGLVVILLAPATVLGHLPYKIQPLEGGYLFEGLGNVLLSHGHLELTLVTPVSELMAVEEKLTVLVDQLEKSCYVEGCEIQLRSMREKLKMLHFLGGTSREKRGLGTWFLSLFGLRPIDELDELNMEIVKSNEKLLNLKLGHVQAEVTQQKNWTSALVSKMYDNLNKSFVDIQNLNLLPHSPYVLHSVQIFNAMVDAFSHDFRFIVSSYNSIAKPGALEMEQLLEGHPEVIARLPNHLTESLAASVIHSTILEEEFRTIVKIPVYEKLPYPLFNIVSVPVVKRGHLELPENAGVLIAIHQSSKRYFKFSMHDLEAYCVMFKSSLRGCTVGISYMYNEVSSCVVRALFGNSTICPSTKVVSSPGYYQKLMANGFLFARTAETSVSLKCENGDFHEKLSGVGIIQFLGHCTLSDGGILLHAHATSMFSFDLHHKNVSFKVSSLGTGKSRVLTLKPLESTSKIAELSGALSLMGLEMTEFVTRPAAICGISFTTLVMFLFVGYLLRGKISKYTLPLPSFGRPASPSDVTEVESRAASNSTGILQSLEGK